MDLPEVLSGEAIDGSPERAQHGEGERRNGNEGNDDEISEWNVTVEEAVLVFCMVEWCNTQCFWFGCLVRSRNYSTTFQRLKCNQLYKAASS